MKKIEENLENLKQKKLVDGFGRGWNHNLIPEYIKELNSNPIGLEYQKDGWWFSKHLKLKNADFKIDVLLELIDKSPYYRMWTDDLKYGEHLEIIFSNKKQCFTIKDIDKLLDNWKYSKEKWVVMDELMDIYNTRNRLYEKLRDVK